MTTLRRRPPRARQHGAAILLAMLIMTLVATLAAGMVWLQWRGIEVETAERARGQGEWLLDGALDWGGLILQSSIRGGHSEDDLGQPWATPLAETKLASFLSADGSHSDDSGPEAYLSGQISDAAAKYNLYNLVFDQIAAGTAGTGGAAIATSGRAEQTRFLELCTAIGVPPDAAQAIVAGFTTSYSATQSLTSADGTPQKDTTNSVLMPTRIADLAWYGVDPKIVAQLQPFVVLLPLVKGVDTAMTNINVNTAPAEVLMAAMPGISRAQAEQVIQRRQQKPFVQTGDVTTVAGYVAPAAGSTNPPPPALVDVKSDFFEVYGQLRYEQHVIRQRSLVHRLGANKVVVISKERLPPDVQ